MNTKEIWKAVADSNGEYQVSTYGRVKSFKHGKERILKPGLQAGNYLFVILSMKGKKRKILLHQLVALSYIENTYNKPQVNHIDGTKTNNHIGNLEWVTAKENIQHAWENGLCESTRKAVIKSRSKAVIDIITNKKYDSLKDACLYINEPYMRHAMRIFQKSKNQRFFYL
jgi:hypothetical protein